MRGVVVEAAAALGALGAPGRALALQHHRPVGLGQHVGDPADGAGLDQPLQLAEGAGVAVVIADLVHQALRPGERGQLLGLAPVEAERLLAEDVDAGLERLAHHRPVQPRGRRHDHPVEPGRQHRVVVAEHRHAGIAADHVEHEPGGIADHHLGLGVRVDDGEVRQSHLAEPGDADLDH